jgi:hypothetical protein
MNDPTAAQRPRVVIIGAIWSVAHIYFLIGFGNRLVVAMNWTWNYLTFQRGTRLINRVHRLTHRGRRAADDRVGPDARRTAAGAGHAPSRPDGGQDQQR